MPVRTPPISTVARKGNPTPTIRKSNRLRFCTDIVLPPLVELVDTSCGLLRLSTAAVSCIMRPIKPTSSNVPAVSAHAWIKLELLVGTGNAVDATSSNISSAASKFVECLA